MDRFQTPTADHTAAVQTAGLAALDLLSRATTGERREPALTARTRRAVSEVSIPGQPETGGHAEGESQTHAAADAHSGHRGAVSETELEPARAGAPGVSVPAACLLLRLRQQHHVIRITNQS